MGNRIPLDFSPLHFCGEANKGFGEDNWCYGFSGETGLIAVFDGCGGIGARTHKIYSDHTEAYMASRLCSGACYETLQELAPYGTDAAEFLQSVSARLGQRLRDNAPPAAPGSVVIKGMLTLPTTAAAAHIRAQPGGLLHVSPIWAGDSRVYRLDASGLSQLSVDDSNQPDPMEGLFNDGVLSNRLCADKPVHLNQRSYLWKPPFILLTATDGCYGYVSTPMELEGMILHTMLESESVAQWEQNLQKLIASYAGDDHTMCLASFGYPDFAAMQRVFSPRYQLLRRDYLDTVWKIPQEDRDTRRRLWAHYRPNYMKYIEGDTQ